jgi:hypothetical protein
VGDAMAKVTEHRLIADAQRKNKLENKLYVAI